MNPTKRTIEDLLLDDSFCNYCFKTNEEDLLFWETYLEFYPEEKSTLLAAKAMVLGLKEAIHTHKRNKLFFLQPLLRIAAVLLIAVGAYFTYEWIHPAAKQNKLSQQTADSSQSNFIVYTTAPGERKKIRLPDSSTVELNVASRLQLTKEFNNTNRDIYLEGEALFDVTHNEELPFIVQTPTYEVRVLGTLFNVKAYPGESISETSLIRGKVKLFKADGGHLTLLPLQKVVFENNTNAVKSYQPDAVPESGIQHIMPVTKSLEGEINEISWTENTLQFQNESMLEIKAKLERWYNINIEWKDSIIGTYRFTGSFRDEPIEKVLEALQFSYPFNYAIDQNTIILSK
ncbi:FecR family protein [Flavihumibacter sp. UBA7668]|uniref:FecR family protein n=1 Tax=Flavihumibacter sp. UBA7668 TaxID=1946542 RepID=UPI0025BA7AF3|nr:FecR family protein [Flavihumibacter sp. UBA7668]